MSSRAAAAAALLIPLAAGCETTVNIEEQMAPTQAVQTPTPTVWLEGHLQVSPPTIDFGPVGVGCRGTEQILVRNAGLTPVQIYGISAEIGADVFLIDNRSGTLEYQDYWELPVIYRPDGAHASSYGEVWIQSNDSQNELHRVGLNGALYPGTERLDRLHQEEAFPSDFLWVIDASSSMASDIDRVLGSFSAFINGLYREGVNYHMAFVTMDLPNDQGHLIGTYGDEELPYITRDMGEPAVEALRQNMSYEAHNNDDDVEAGLMAIKTALSEDNLAPGGRHEGFIREGAQLVIVVMTDDHDYSDGRTTTPYQDHLLELKGSVDLVAFHAIMATDESELEENSGCADGIGDEYEEMVYLFGGEIESICATDYSGILATLGSYDTAELTDTFPLTGPPLIEAGITVSVGAPDGSGMVEQEEGVAWVYHSDLNAVIFNPGHLPPAGATVDIAYIDAGACSQD